MMWLVEAGLASKYMKDEYEKVAVITRSNGTTLDVAPLGLNCLFGAFGIP